MKFISNLSLKRISKVRDSLENQLKQLVPTDNQIRTKFEYNEIIFT